RRPLHGARPRRLGTNDTARRQDQIHPVASQPRKSDRSDDLLAARCAEEAGRGRSAPQIAMAVKDVGGISDLAYARGRTGLLRGEDQGAEREPRRAARARPGGVRRRGADGLRRTAGARGARGDRRRNRQPLSAVTAPLGSLRSFALALAIAAPSWAGADTIS